MRSGSFLQYEQKYDKAMQQVFGRILLCNDLTVATVQARQHRITCVTASGEKAHFRGAIESGYVNASKTRIGVMHSIALAEGKIRELREERHKCQGMLWHHTHIHYMRWRIFSQPFCWHRGNS